MTVKPALTGARGYGIAGALVVLASALAFLLGPDVEIQLAPLLFIAAGMLAAWFAGPGPGLTAVLLSIAIVEYCWVEPRFTIAIAPGELPWFITFVFTGFVAMGVSLQRRRFETELAASRDALEVRVAERTEQLRVSEERWRKLFETSSVGIAIAERNGRIMQANGALQTMLGYSEVALTQMTLEDLIYDSDQHHLPPSRQVAAESRSELPLRRQDGQVLWVSLSLSEIPAGQHSPALLSAVVIDVSERRRALDDWRRAQIELGRVSRLTTMGMLSVSIAHEVNQPLSAIVTNGQAALRWMRSDPPNLAEAQQALDRMIRDGNRAAEVIRSIRNLLAPAGNERQPLSLHAVLRALLPLVEHELAEHHVALTLELEAATDQVLGDPVQLQQLLLNLVMNGLDSLRGTPQRKRQLRIASAVKDGQLVLTVEDNGRGLGEDVDVDRLFEPFYTTKPDGMGVGLAICHHVVERHGGRIWAEKRDPVGARFLFALPLAGGDGSVGVGRTVTA
jgi:PAS domain S-box-containing protein